MSGGIIKPFLQRYVTPQDAPTRFISRRILIPDDPQFIAAVSEVLSVLLSIDVWDESEGISAQDCAWLCADMYDEFSQDFYMIGLVVPVAAATMPPNILLCDGSTYNRVDYPELYDAIDPAYHVDADTFTVPLLTDRVPVGAGGSFPVNSVGGEKTHTLTIAEMPAHDHPQKVRRTATTTGTNDRVMTYGSGGTDGLTNNTIDDTGGGAAHNNMQPYIALRYGIVAR